MNTSNVINVVNVVPGDSLSLILLLQVEPHQKTSGTQNATERDIRRSTNLFKLKNVLVEVILKLLIGVVNAELFEAVGLEVFEAEDVEHADRQALKERRGK